MFLKLSKNHWIVLLSCPFLREVRRRCTCLYYLWHIYSRERALTDESAQALATKSGGLLSAGRQSRAALQTRRITHTHSLSLSLYSFLFSPHLPLARFLTYSHIVSWCEAPEKIHVFSKMFGKYWKKFVRAWQQQNTNWWIFCDKFSEALRGREAV